MNGVAQARRSSMVRRRPSRVRSLAPTAGRPLYTRCVLAYGFADRAGSSFSGGQHRTAMLHACYSSVCWAASMSGEELLSFFGRRVYS